MTVTLVALPGPLLVSVTVNPISSPAENGPVSATLVSSTSGQSTVSESLSVLFVRSVAASLSAEAVASLV